MSKTDDLNLGSQPATGSKKKMIILLAILVLVLIAGGVAAWLLLGGKGEDGDKPAEHAEEAAPAAAHGEETISYYALDPVFVASLPGKPRMLQVGIRLRLRYPETLEFLERNAPMLRASVLSLLSAQDGQTLKSREAKEKLRGELKEQINKLIQQYRGQGTVDEVFFSSFVTQ